MNEQQIQDLQLAFTEFDGDVHFDRLHRKIYSVDASIFEVEPIGIVIPRTKEALIFAVNTARRHGVPIIPRGAATGITGGCLGTGLIIDLSKYFNKILTINTEERYAICESGVVQDQLNHALEPSHLRLGPDTSTGNRATLGGMVGNNASGARSLRYGVMADHLIELELLLASGELLQFKEISQLEWENKLVQQNAEGAIYRTLEHLRREYHHEIEQHLPKLPKRSSGYNIDALLSPFPINPCRLIAGAEGTLGIVTQMKVKSCPRPKTTGLCLIHFNAMEEALQSVTCLLKEKPLALEMIDDKIIQAGRTSPALRDKLQFLQNDPKAVVIVEFDADTIDQLQVKLQQFTQDLIKNSIGYTHTVLLDATSIATLWEMRKSGLGLLLSKRTYSRAIAFIEDISVAPDQLASFMQKFYVLLKSHQKEAGIYGHVGSGCMHIRPYIDLRSPEELALMQKIMLEVTNLVLEHHGSLSGEHGDGYIRTWLNRKQFGKELYRAFQELKHAFDPDHLMNPDKIVSLNEAMPAEELLRIHPQIKQTKISTFQDFTNEGGFELAVDLCNGNGLCRKPEKLMCPSFQATHDEFDTTRARAQALRAVINGRLPVEDFSSHALYDVLDLCLQCKGCKTECPSEVNMAKMKTEFLYHYYNTHGTPLRELIFSRLDIINRWTQPVASLFNLTNRSGIGKLLRQFLNISPKRPLPDLARKRFSSLFKQATIKSDKTVVLFNDTFTEFNTPDVGLAAVKVLQALGYEVISPAWQCCGRAALSKGKLKHAKQLANKLIETLLPYAKRGIPIIGLEPSCILTIKDDFAALTRRELKILSEATVTFDQFIAKHIHDGKLPIPLRRIDSEIHLHIHCHQKALVGNGPTLSILKAIPDAKFKEIDSGCCGMAGSFGYEKEHYDLSMQIGELKLFPAIRNIDENGIIIANGSSCRHQITHGTERHALHLAEFLANQL